MGWEDEKPHRTGKTHSQILLQKTPPPPWINPIYVWGPHTQRIKSPPPLDTPMLMYLELNNIIYMKIRGVHGYLMKIEIPKDY